MAISELHSFQKRVQKEFCTLRTPKDFKYHVKLTLRIYIKINVKCIERHQFDEYIITFENICNNAIIYVNICSALILIKQFLFRSFPTSSYTIRNFKLYFLHICMITVQLKVRIVKEKSFDV